MINRFKKNFIHTPQDTEIFSPTTHEAKQKSLPLSDKEKFENALKFCQSILNYSGKKVSFPEHPLIDIINLLGKKRVCK